MHCWWPGIRSWALGVVVLFGLLGTMGARADTYSTGGNACSGCHGVSGIGTPPRLPSQFSNILIGANLNESCASGSCSLRTRIESIPTMINAGVSGSFTNAQLETVRLYLRQARFGEVSNGTPSFPNTLIGDNVTDTFSVTVRNYRGANVSYSFSLVDSEFALVSPPGAATCTATTTTSPTTCTVNLTVRFTPLFAGTRTATLNVIVSPADASDPDPSNDTIALSAVGVTPAPIFSVSPNPQTFSAQVNQTDTRSVTITNSVSATANLQLGASAFSFSRSEYTRSGTSTCANSTSLAPGSSCTLAINFVPTTAGAVNGSVSISHNAAGSPSSVTLNGTGLQGSFSTGGTTALPFGNVNRGASAQLAFTITNNGTAALTGLTFPITSTVAGDTPGDFTTPSGTCLTVGTLNVGISCTLAVTFTPQGDGARAATLTLSATSSSNAPTVRLTGTGVALGEPTIDPAAVVPAFPSTVIGDISPTTRVVTITNTRANPINYTRSITGPNAGDTPADFTIVGESCPTRVVANGTPCTITLRFAPLAGSAGTRTARLALAFTGTGSDPAPVSTPALALSGPATTPAPAFSILANTLPISAVVGTPNSNSTTITNTGSADLVLNNLAFSGSFGAEFSLAAGNTCTAGMTIARQTSCTLVVQFAPASASPASRDATLTITHNAAGSPNLVTLAGTASAAPQSGIDLQGTTALVFGPVNMGSNAQLSFSIRNNGVAALTFTSFPISGAAAADFVRTGTCSTASSVPANATCSVVITFTPGAVGARTATLTINSNAGNVTTPPTVALSGQGVALDDVAVAPDVVDPFPSTLVGTTSSVTRTVTVTNPRVNAVNYTSSFTGTNSADFSVSAESCPTRVVPGGASCTLTLQFTPSAAAAAGTRSATMAFSFTGTGSDPAPAPRSAAVSGIAAGPTPSFSISSSTLTFTATVGTTQVVTALITSNGSAPLVLSSLTFGGASAAEYSFAPANTCVAALSLAPGSSCTLAIQFLPVAAGTRNATLSIAHNATGSPAVVTLNGTATAAPQGHIVLSSLTLTFADTQLGSSSAQTVTVQNDGTLALTFSAFTAGGTHPGDFERSGTCSTATPLAIGAQCTLTITFRPTALGARTATLTIASDASNGAVMLTFTGNAVPIPAPVASLTPATLPFGSQTVGGLYPPRTVALANTGTADLNVASVVVQGAGFTDASAAPCPAVLAPGAGCDIAILFTPTAANTNYSGSLVVTSNAAGSPHSVALSGSGAAGAVAVLVWSPAVTNLDFGTVTAGSVSATQTATLLNQGPGGVNLTLLNTVGVDAAVFSVSGGSCQIGMTLFQGETCTIDVRFVPASAGARSAAVQVASTGSFPPTLTLSGTGLGGPSPGIAVSAATLSFGDTRVGALSLPEEIRLLSNGSGVVRVMALAITGPYVVQSKSCPSVPFTLAAGSECSLTVTFLPQAEGNAAGQLQVTTDASPATREVALSGNGAAKADVSSGGCSIASGDAATDPTLWLLVLLALAALLYRRRVRAAQRRAEQTGHEST